MLMEEENVCSSPPHCSDSSLQPPQQGSLTSIDHRYVNGEQQVIVWDEMEVQTNQAQGADQPSVSLKAGRDTPEEAEQWEPIIWQVCPMTSVTSASLSCATVQWDMPDLSTETPSLMTDSGLANEPDSDGVPSPGTTSPSLCRDINAELFSREDGEEEDGFDSQLLDLNLEWTGNGFELMFMTGGLCCNFQPCDAADVQEPSTQEKEDCTPGLLESEIPPVTDTEEEEEQSGTSDPLETVDLIDSLEEIEGSEDEAESFVDLNLGEEQEEPGVLLTGEGDWEGEQTSTSDESEEGSAVEEEEGSVTNVSRIVSCLSDVEFTAEPPQTEDTGPALTPDKLSQTEEPEMCEDVDESVDPEQSEAVHDNEEPSTQAADDAERTENSQEVPEQTEKTEETSCSQHQDCDQMTLPDVEMSERSEPEQLEMTEEPEEVQAEEPHSEDSDQLGQSQHLEQSPQMETIEESTQPENADQPEEESTQSEQTVCAEAEDLEVVEGREQMEPSEQDEQSPQTIGSSQPALSDQLVQPEKTDEPEMTEQTEVAQQTAEAKLNQVDKQITASQQAEVGGGECGTVQTVVVNGKQPKPSEAAVPHMNGGEVDRNMACRLAERLYKLDGIQRVDVVKHLDKDNDFSRAVGEEYLKFFDFTGQTLDHALRSFLKVVVLIGETQERERVLQQFACRFHQCNPDSFSSSGAVLALTCALMLLNTDLHGQNVGKSMSSSKFVSNLDGMNEGENFHKDLLKSLYNSIKSEALEWAVDEEELKSSVLVDEDAADDAPLRSKANPFQDVPHDKTASVVKEGFLQRKLHADIDGKRTPWGKRGWKTFYGVLRGMVLYLQKNDYRKEQPTNEEVVSVHHSLAEQAADYTKKPHVFRLQTADWRVFLFQASSKVEMNSWISRINLVSALHSSPPFPAAVGSQRRFCRPILPASQSAQTLERQLQSHAGMLESFKADLSYLQQNLPEGKKARAKELEEHRVRAEYLQHEMCRYEIYIRMLEAWKNVKKTGEGTLNITDLSQFDKGVCADSVGEDEEDGGLKKSYSSPSLELEMPPPTVIKVKRNISERRTYRKTIIPRLNKEA
ncbi:hypothetical protein L3Q82_002144 [Scortum barcoo]|uniref:Uncharacterized protein n=1 Tax=Scortum barcoo TaxID=214431 RepID=A0ACB8W1Q8_9TELE|nr:hypothetical protein L3Q82_002144 [Scortum barcoo]